MTPWHLESRTAGECLALGVSAFRALVAAALGLYAVAHLAPGPLVRFNSVPWTFQLQKVLDLRYQAVLYSAFHSHPIARLTHLSLVWEQPVWFALLWLWHPAAAAVGLSLLVAEAVAFRTRWLAFGLSMIWVVVAAFGWLLARSGDPEVVGAVCMTVLACGGPIRAFGHLFEPLPPGVGVPERFSSWRSARLGAPMLVGPITGVVSEFAASPPFRLFPVLVLWGGGKLGFRSERHGAKPDHDAEAARVLEGGWRASPVTAWMAGRDA